MGDNLIYETSSIIAPNPTASRDPAVEAERVFTQLLRVFLNSGFHFGAGTRSHLVLCLSLSLSALHAAGRPSLLQLVHTAGGALVTPRLSEWKPDLLLGQMAAAS